jgi:hypothetical protein
MAPVKMMYFRALVFRNCGDSKRIEHAVCNASPQAAIQYNKLPVLAGPEDRSKKPVRRQSPAGVPLNSVVPRLLLLPVRAILPFRPFGFLMASAIQYILRFQDGQAE